MTEKRQRQAIKAKRGETFRLDPNDILIPPPGHPLYDPSSPTKASPDLVKKIEAIGFFGVVTVTKLDGRLYALLGRDRILAMREVNIARRDRGEEPLLIEAQHRVVKDFTLAARMIAAENKTRRKVTQVADAGYAVSMQNQGMTHEMIADELKVSLGTVRNLLRLGAQPDFVLEAVARRELSIGEAKRLEGTDAEKRAAVNAAKERGGAGAGKGRKRNMRTFLASARELGVELDGPTWKKLQAAWKQA